MLNQFKNFVIVALVVCAVYLTGKLWFDEISNHNFFYTVLSFFSTVQPATEVEQNYFAKPAKIITSFGDGSFDILYNGMEQSDQKKNGDEVISLALSNGEYMGVAAVNLEELFKNSGYIYSYAAEMPSSVFVKSYSQKKNLLTSKVRAFSLVLIQNKPDSNISVVFVDTTGRAYEYSVDGDLKERISEHISSLKNDKSRLKYTYERSFFIPRLPEEGFNYPAVTMENQYMDEGGLLMDYIKKRVSVFFAGAGSKWESSFTYSDETTVVKYFPSEVPNGFDVLEYSYYQMSTRRMTTLAADYNTALHFIGRDTTVTNEFYLEKASVNDTQKIFYFNYAINDLPISISSVNSEQLGLNYPIEIVVENGIVTKYRKLVYKFSSDSSNRLTAGTSFENILHGMLEVDEEPDALQLDNVSLNYKIDVNNELALYWFLDMSGITYVRSAQAGFR